MSLESDTSSPIRSGLYLRGRRAILCGSAASVAAPVTILLHELGHYLADKAFGFPNVVLHYGSTSNGAAEAGFPLWQQGISAAAGPLTTIAILLLCCYIVARYGPHPVAVATGLVAPIRMFIIGVLFIMARMKNANMSGNFDELNASRAGGVSVDWLIAIELLALVAAWWYLASRIPRRERMLALLSCMAGMIVGLVLWIGLLGRVLLP